MEKCPKNNLDLKEMFSAALDEHFGLRGDMYELLPDKEPERNKTLNDGKWLVQVGSPFLPEEAKDKVKQALGKMIFLTFIYRVLRLCQN